MGYCGGREKYIGKSQRKIRHKHASNTIWNSEQIHDLHTNKYF
jgi:hypothetical protein